MPWRTMDIKITGHKNSFMVEADGDRLNHIFSYRWVTLWMQEITEGSPFESGRYWFIVRGSRREFTKKDYREILVAAVRWIMICE